MTLDVILPIYNCPDLEDRCIRYLLLPGTLPPGARLIVVDDASPDLTTWNTWGKVLTHLGHLYYRKAFNRGCHAAWNTGLSLSRPDADIALVGSDVVVPPFVLERLQGVAAANAFGLLGARDVTADAWHPSMLQRLFELNTNENRVDGNHAISSCCVIRRETLNSVGTFDEQFLMTFGDTDWNERARVLGVKMAQVTNAVVFHGKSVSRKRLGAESDLAVDLEDHKRFMEKWRDRPDVLARHPLPSQDALALKKHFWQEGEQ